MGVVIDEFGGIEGIITMEDIVEEILSGSAPRDGSEFYIEPLGHGKFLVSGHARLDDLTEHLGFQIDAEGIDTIGGFIFTHLGYVPSSGTKVEIPGLLITVRHAARKRIEEVLLEKTTNVFEEAA
jgi:CBS domain containing-hemolysin-like protein